MFRKDDEDKLSQQFDSIVSQMRHETTRQLFQQVGVLYKDIVYGMVSVGVRPSEAKEVAKRIILANVTNNTKRS